MKLNRPSRLAHRAIWSVALALLVLPTGAEGAGRRISYQGQLTGVTGATTVQFRIFDATATPVWGPEIHVVTPDAEGRFVAVVGATDLDVSPADGVPDLDQLAPDDLELEVAVEDGGGSMVVLSPRQQLFASFHATTAGTVLDGAITTPKLADEAVTAAKIAAATVTGAQVALETLTGAHVADGSIASSDVQDNSLTAADIAADAITSSEVSVDVAQSIPPTAGGIESFILARGGCPKFKGVEIYTRLGFVVFTLTNSSTVTLALCEQ